MNHKPISQMSKMEKMVRLFGNDVFEPKPYCHLRLYGVAAEVFGDMFQNSKHGENTVQAMHDKNLQTAERLARCVDGEVVWNYGTLTVQKDGEKVAEFVRVQ